MSHRFVMSSEQSRIGGCLHSCSSLHISRWLVPLALAKQGRIDEASGLADALAERYTRIGAEGRIYRGVALSIARRSRGRPEEALTLAHEAASIARSTDSNLLRALALEHLAALQCETDPPAATIHIRASSSGSGLPIRNRISAEPRMTCAPPEPSSLTPVTAIDGASRP